MIEQLYEAVKKVYETEKALQPIDTAIARKSAEYDSLVAEVANLEEYKASLQVDVANASEVIRRAEEQRKAADIYMQQVRRDAEDLENRSRSKAATIIRNEYAKRDEVEKEIEQKLLYKRQIQQEIDSLYRERSAAEAELGPLKAEVEALRHQRASYLR